MKGIIHPDTGLSLDKVEYEGDTAHDLQSGAGFPGAPSEKDLFYRTDQHRLYIYNGIAWIDLVSAGNLWSPVTFGTNGISRTPDGITPQASCINASDQGCVSFAIPADFGSLISAVLVVRPIATQAAANWDLYSSYAAVGEAYNTHSETDEVTTYNVTANQLFAVDVSGILTGIAAGDFGGITILLANATHDFALIGLLIRYNRS